MGVAESRLGRSARVLGPKINEMSSYVFFQLTTFQVNKIKASWPKINFCDFCLQKMGVAQSPSCCDPRVLGPKINEMFSYGLYSTNHIPS